MKPLKPSARERKRYLLIKGDDLKKDVEKSILDFIGVLGMSKVGLIWIKSGKNSAVISVSRDSLNHVRASFAVWPKKIDVVKVSGSIKGLGK
jgi:RNase P/RNase MRP subunit POP5